MSVCIDDRLVCRFGWDCRAVSSQLSHQMVIYTGLFKMIVWVLTTCHTQYTSDSSMQLHRWIKKFSKFSFMMCGVQ